MKALNNFVAAAGFAACAEALLAGQRFGLDPARMVEILNVSTGRSFHTDLVLREHVVGGKFATGFQLGLLAKDVRIAADLAHELRLDAPLAAPGQRALRDRTRCARLHARSYRGDQGLGPEQRRMNATGPAVDVVEVIDSARYFGWPLAITILTILIMLVDGYDLQTMAFVAPAIVADWGIARADLIWVLNGSLIGMAIGSVVLGRLGDRVGRKSAFIACLLSPVRRFAAERPCPEPRRVVRVAYATGIGLGGLTPLAATFISEWTPRRVRSIAVACAVVSVPLGGMLGAMIAQRAIPSFGWRAIFWIGTAPAAAVRHSRRVAAAGVTEIPGTGSGPLATVWPPCSTA